MAKAKDFYKAMVYEFKFWKEYPERDMEYVRWYPVNFESRENLEQEIWRKRDYVGYYVHIPFCKNICHYCPFNKYLWRQESVDRYLRALKKEIEMYAEIPYLMECRFIGGYYGGGTPTCLTTEELVNLINWVHDKLDVIPNAEITVEMNPETIDETKLRALREAGVNRISIGVQSFNDRLLAIMGRGHTSDVAISAITLAKKVGFPVISIDLMYWFPTETIQDWEEDLKRALEFDLDHYSCFYLVLSPGTRLYNRVLRGELPPQPEIQLSIEMYELAIDMFEKAGYRQYTCSDFAKEGKECLRHKIDWAAPQGEYIGCGAGAFSYIRGWHYCNVHSLKRYIEEVEKKRLPILMGTRVTKQEEMARFLVLGVKFLEVSKRKFEEQFGIKMESVYADILQKLEQLGLITVDPDYIKVTRKGKIYIDNISKAFFSQSCYRKPQPIAVEIATGRGIR